MVEDWERHPGPTRRDMERRKSVDKAIADIELASQGKQPNQSLTKSLAIVLLEIYDEVGRTSRDVERAMTGVQAVLRALSNEHQDVRDYLSGSADVHRRGNDPSVKR